MELQLDVQNATGSLKVPTRDELAHWTEAALLGRRERAELTIRLVGETEGAALNRRYRGREGPTNVLSFPFEPPPGLGHCDLMGDLVICAPVVEREAREQGKRAAAHWAHMVVHGVLHLLGYDHRTDAQASEMEGLETAILGGLGFAAPYENGD